MISHHIHVVPHQGPQHLQQRRPKRYAERGVHADAAGSAAGWYYAADAAERLLGTHPEAVLLAIVADSDVAVRAQAVGEI